jgi:hypothetical protein
MKKTASIMAVIESNSITREKTPHESGKFSLVTAEQQMKMIGHNGPGKTICSGFFKKDGKTLQEFRAVFIIKKNITFFNTANNNMLQQAGDIQAWFSKHRNTIYWLAR